MMVQLTTRQQAARSGRARRLKDIGAQQRALEAMGVRVPIEMLQGLPCGAWLRFVPDERPLRLSRCEPED
jgi:hypothetical protein